VSIDELTRVVPPPEQPIEPGDLHQWAIVEHGLALARLPTDLFDLAHAYGTGFFMVEARNAIKILNPFSDEYWPQLLHICRLERRSKEMTQNAGFPFGIYPDSVGLLPIGTDRNGGTLYWHTEVPMGTDLSLYWLTKGGEPQWPIIANPPGYRVFERFDLALTSFLSGCFTSRIRCVLWGESTFAGNPRVFFKSTKSLNAMAT
jgi:hypothetical protein